MRVGLIGYCGAKTGLAIEAERLYAYLPFDGWLCVDHPTHGLRGMGLIPRDLQDAPYAELSRYESSCKGIYNWNDTRSNALDEAVKWARGFDVLVSVERVWPPHLWDKVDCKKVLLANAEWVQEGLPWFQAATTIVARTWQTQRALEKCGYGDKTVRLKHPMPKMPTRIREKFERVHYSAGGFGVFDRKGWPEAKQYLAARPRSLHLYSMRPPSHTEGLAPDKSQFTVNVDTSAEIWEHADLAFMPERFNGLALSILEPLAMGCPVIATKCEPHIEYLQGAYGAGANHFLIDVDFEFPVRIWDHNWRASIISIGDAVEKIDRLRGWPSAGVGHASAMCLRYINEHHGEQAWADLWDEIVR